MINSGLLRRLVRSPSALAGVVMTGVFLATALLAVTIQSLTPESKK